MHKRKKGGIAEEFACEYLANKGYEILERNFHARYGEIDIISQENGEIVFCEVKSLSEEMGQEIYATVTKQKMLRLQKAINFWLYKHKLTDARYRLDFIGVILDKDNIPLKIEHFSHVGETNFHIY